MPTFIGQRLEDSATLPGRYIRMPAAANAFIRDDRPIGANVAMVVHNNLSHLCNENVRHLALWQGNASLSQLNGWSGLRDGAEPDSSEPTGEEWEISWSRDVARHFGPFLGVQDRIGTNGEPLLRRVVVDVDVTYASLTLHCALVEGFTPLPPYHGPLAYSRTTPSSGVNTINLDATATIGPAEAIVCRPGATTYGALAYPAWFWVWVGWESGSASDRIKAISIYEQRD